MPGDGTELQAQQSQKTSPITVLQPGQDPTTNRWYQNYYRIRKKALSPWNKYWIEDYSKNILGFSKQKMFKLKEDIRIYTDEGMQTEMFRIQQQEIVDLWGTFAVIDSSTNIILGYIKRKALKSTFAWDEWEILDGHKKPIGGIDEEHARGLVRKLPGGGLIPEKMTLLLDDEPVAEIDQDFKVIGDIWDLKCIAVPNSLDRRVLLGALLLMGMIERKHK
jgi:hypothetical protein